MSKGGLKLSNQQSETTDLLPLKLLNEPFQLVPLHRMKRNSDVAVQPFFSVLCGVLEVIISHAMCVCVRLYV